MLQRHRLICFRIRKTIVTTMEVPVVDLFSGPGGLAEGFSACNRTDGSRCYRVALSIEKDEAAYRTLRLRTFLHLFERELPAEYYDLLNGMTREEPDWSHLYPDYWAAACEATSCMELGKKETSRFVRERLKSIRGIYGGRTVLLGGPPCQSYSVVGRSRNAGNEWYDPELDNRQSLYKEYVKVLRLLRPAVAVMENVKGMLSARHNGRLIFPDVMHNLQRRWCGDESYRLFALAPGSDRRTWDNGATAKDFLVKAENHGIPQTRHRVFVICIRNDIAKTLPEEYYPYLEPWDAMVPLQSIIGAMPRLRSRLSRGDSPESWQMAVKMARHLVAANRPSMSYAEEDRFERALRRTDSAVEGVASPFRSDRGGCALPRRCPPELRKWISDTNVERLPNNETRAHIADDLARYLYASAFGRTFRKSPKTHQFPKPLVPSHASWSKGIFRDRYRVQLSAGPCNTITSHIAKDGHYFIHPDPGQARSLTVREVARLQTFPDNYFFHGSRTQQYVQVGNAVPPFLAHQIARLVRDILDHHDRVTTSQNGLSIFPVQTPHHEVRPHTPASMDAS